MSVSKEYFHHIIELLSDFQIETLPMFGGILLKVDNRQLGVILMGELFFKAIVPSLQKKLQTEGSRQFSYVRKDKKDPVVIKNWWSIPSKYLESSENLNQLAKEILSQKS